MFFIKKKILDFQANFSIQRALNSKFVLQEDVTFGGQSHLKLLANIQKNLFSHLECSYLPIYAVKLHKIELQDLMV